MESLICKMVGKIQDQGAAEAVRVREAIGKAIAVLEAAGAYLVRERVALAQPGSDQCF